MTFKILLSPIYRYSPTRHCTQSLTNISLNIDEICKIFTVLDKLWYINWNIAQLYMFISNRYITSFSAFVKSNSVKYDTFDAFINILIYYQGIFGILYFTYWCLQLYCSIIVYHPLQFMAFFINYIQYITMTKNIYALQWCHTLYTIP